MGRKSTAPRRRFKQPRLPLLRGDLDPRVVELEITAILGSGRARVDNRVLPAGSTPCFPLGSQRCSARATTLLALSGPGSSFAVPLAMCRQHEEEMRNMITATRRGD